MGGLVARHAIMMIVVMMLGFATLWLRDDAVESRNSMMV
jgi:hypothetical protein